MEGDPEYNVPQENDDTYAAPEDAVGGADGYLVVKGTSGSQAGAGDTEGRSRSGSVYAGFQGESADTAC